MMSELVFDADNCQSDKYPFIVCFVAPGEIFFYCSLGHSPCRVFMLKPQLFWNISSRGYTALSAVLCCFFIDSYVMKLCLIKGIYDGWG